MKRVKEKHVFYFFKEGMSQINIRVDTENYNFSVHCSDTEVWILSQGKCTLLPSVKALKRKKEDNMI